MENQRGPLWPRMRFPAFFLLFYLYVWLRIDPSLLYQAGPWSLAFSRGRPFFASFLPCPGGLVKYAAAALSQLDFYPWAGALVITGIAWLMCVATGRLIAAFGVSGGAWIRYAPALGLLVVRGRYGCHAQSELALLIALLGAALYAGATSWKTPWRGAAFLLISVALYYAAGGAYIIFAALCGILELRLQQRLLGLVYVLAGEVVPYVVGVLILYVTPVVAYSSLLPINWRADVQGRFALLGLYLFFPILAIALTRWPSLAQRLSERFAALPVRPALRGLLLCALMAAPVCVSFSGAQKSALRIQYYANHMMWDDVLAEAKRLQPREFTFGITHDVNRALFRTGRLPHDMFAYPQCAESLILGVAMSTGTPSIILQMRKQLFFEIGDVDLQLGLLNEAEHEAHEALETYGNHSTILERLALINEVKGQTDAARVFLSAMTRDLIHRRRAEDALRRLDAQGGVFPEDTVRHIRAVGLRDDDVLGVSLEERCLALLAERNRNQMAFEYLMAYYLVTRQLDKLVEHIHRLDHYAYAGIPRHYEEAIVLYEAETGNAVDLHGHWVSHTTAQRFAHFSGIVAPREVAGQRERARQMVVDAYGNSYFFYYVFGESGAGMTES